MASAGPTPLPYGGDDFTRLHRIGTRHERSGFWADRSGRNRYEISSLGFRGAEFDPAKPRRVFVFGESHAFGQGLQLEEAWPMLAAQRFAATIGAAPDDVGTMNFAEPGASNAYIARMVLSQCERVRPDLVIVHFARSDRSEAAVGGRPVRVGPWFGMPFVDKQVANAPPHLRELAEEWRACGHAFTRYRTDDGELLETLRHLHLVRAYLHVRGIPAIATCDERERMLTVAGTDGHPLQPLAAGICEGPFLTRHALADAGPADAHAPDDVHWSAGHHETFARQLAAEREPTPPAVPLAAERSPPLVLADADEPWIDRALDGAAHERCVDAGISNARIVRELLTRCATARPERVLVQFADHRAHESCDTRGCFDIPPEPAHGWLERLLDDRKRRSRAFHAFAGDHARALETLRCVLTVQFVCEALGVPLQARCRTHGELCSDGARSNESLGPLLEQVAPAILQPPDA